jgi:adenylosuccinate synthase
MKRWQFGEYVRSDDRRCGDPARRLRKAGKRVLFEGAQGPCWISTTEPIPYVTSSNTTVGGALAGTGVGA